MKPYLPCAADNSKLHPLRRYQIRTACSRFADLIKFVDIISILGMLHFVYPTHPRGACN